MNFLLGILALNAGTGSWENPVAMALKALEGKVDDEELEKLGKYFADKRARVEVCTFVDLLSFYEGWRC
jgi:hypothetical protein